MLQMPVKVSRGGVQLSGELGNQSGERAEGVGWGLEGAGLLGLDLPDSPKMMQGHLARKTHRLDAVFSDSAVIGRPLQYGKAPYQRISDPAAFSYKQGQRSQTARCTIEH